MIERYLVGREELQMVMVLVDGEVGPTALDQSMLEWLRSEGLPHQVIATKHDKVKAAQREKRKRQLAAACDLEPGDVVWVSATKNVGIDRLRDLVRIWLSPVIDRGTVGRWAAVDRARRPRCSARPPSTARPRSAAAAPRPPPT